jgi:hypothetical protein
MGNEKIPAVGLWKGTLRMVKWAYLSGWSTVTQKGKLSSI